MKFNQIKVIDEDYESVVGKNYRCLIIKDLGFKVGDFVHFYYKDEREDEYEENENNLFKIGQVIKSDKLKDGYCVLYLKKMRTYLYD